jgi:UDP-N-acetylmuramate--alanine ligase
MTSDLRPGDHVHFVGISGFGLSAIARVMLDEGYVVSGCDLKPSRLVEQLKAGGAAVWQGHDPAHLQGRHVDALVISSAVPADNVEVLAAHEAGIPVYKRADVLGTLMAGRVGVGVAGTHGKTTTTAMIAFALEHAGLDPTFIVGGVLRDVGTNARSGQGTPFIVEADEYDAMFLGLRPQVAVVTTLELDHPDMFHSLDEVRALFQQYVDLLPDDGVLVAGYDDPNARALVVRRRESGHPAITYGQERAANLRATNLIPNRFGGTDFVVETDRGVIGLAHLRLPGRHNVSNALAALAVAGYFGVGFDVAARALALFRGVERRFEFKGQVAGVTVIDDYAHHPTAVRATLEAARQKYGDQPIWVVFQPHTYSRTLALLDEFAASFDLAEHVVVTDIYAAREHDDLGVSAEDLVARMAHHPHVVHVGGLTEAVSYLVEHVCPGDLVITMSAGDATRVGEDLLRALAALTDVPPPGTTAPLDPAVLAALERLERGGTGELAEDAPRRSLLKRFVDRLGGR